MRRLTSTRSIQGNGNHAYNEPIQKVFETRLPLILASASPRRKTLLRMLGLEFEIVPSNVEEIQHPDELPEEMARRWAREKTRAVAREHPHHWILGADTLVALEDLVFGKPVDDSEAGEMLQRLGGREHRVISGVCLVNEEAGVEQVFQAATRVRFKSLSRDEIRAYVATGEPLDKAGAYGIQGIGAFLVESVEGSYTNVVGLPLAETLEWLIRHRVVRASASETRK